MKAYKSLADDIQSLLVRYISGIDESERNVLSKNSDIFMIRAEIVASLILSLINLDNRFVVGIPVIVGLNLFSLTQLRVILNDMFLG